jgi:hypothetical protein
VAFTKVLTMYQIYVPPLHHSPSSPPPLKANEFLRKEMNGNPSAINSFAESSGSKRKESFIKNTELMS